MNAQNELQRRRIRESRELLGLSQREMARQGGIPISAVQRIEIGEKVASSPELAAISHATGATIGFLTGEGAVFGRAHSVARAQPDADVASAAAQLLHLMEMDAELDGDGGE